MARYLCVWRDGRAERCLKTGREWHVLIAGVMHVRSEREEALEGWPRKALSVERS